jgi:hypothetical protein
MPIRVLRIHLNLQPIIYAMSPLMKNNQFVVIYISWGVAQFFGKLIKRLVLAGAHVKQK